MENRKRKFKAIAWILVPFVLEELGTVLADWVVL